MKVFASKEINTILFVAENLAIPFTYEAGMMVLKDGEDFQSLAEKGYGMESILKRLGPPDCSDEKLVGHTLDELIRNGTLERVE